MQFPGRKHHKNLQAKKEKEKENKQKKTPKNSPNKTQNNTQPKKKILTTRKLIYLLAVEKVTHDKFLCVQRSGH